MARQKKPTAVGRRGSTALVGPTVRRARPRDRTAASGEEFCIVPGWLVGRVVARTEHEKFVEMTDNTVTVGPLAIPLNLAEVLKPHGDALLWQFQEVAKTIEQSGGVLTSNDTFDWLFASWFSQAALRGYYQALLDNVEKLQLSAKAVADRERFADVRRKGSEANRQKAAPQRMAIRKRFRELRKSGFSPTDARRELEQETGKSFRQLERDTKGLS